MDGNEDGPRHMITDEFVKRADDARESSFSARDAARDSSFSARESSFSARDADLESKLDAEQASRDSVFASAFPSSSGSTTISVQTTPSIPSTPRIPSAPPIPPAPSIASVPTIPSAQPTGTALPSIASTLPAQSTRTALPTISTLFAQSTLFAPTSSVPSSTSPLISVVPKSTASTLTSKPSARPSLPNKLNTVVNVCIGVGAGVLTLAVLGAAIIASRRRRWKKRRAGPEIEKSNRMAGGRISRQQPGLQIRGDVDDLDNLVANSGNRGPFELHGDHIVELDVGRTHFIIRTDEAAQLDR
ncbi:MAG: hypothetical protein Q9160_007153 [Pyrenula sp. 1 TL-2023]